MDFEKLFGNEALTYEKFKELTKDMKLVDLKEGGYVDKNKYDNLLTEKETLKNQIEERDNQLNELKKVNPEELKETIARLQSENETAKANYEKQNHELKVNSALDLALIKAGAKNTKAAKALLDLNYEETKFNDDGSIQGLSDLIKGIQSSDSYLFEDKSTPEPNSGFRGQEPATSSGDPAPAQPKTYADFLKVVTGE